MPLGVVFLTRGEAGFPLALEVGLFGDLVGDGVNGGAGDFDKVGGFSVGLNSFDSSSRGAFVIVPDGVIASWLSGALDGEISMAVCAERVVTGFRHLGGSSLLADQVTVLVRVLGSGGFLLCATLCWAAHTITKTATAIITTVTTSEW